MSAFEQRLTAFPNKLCFALASVIIQDCNIESENLLLMGNAISTMSNVRRDHLQSFVIAGSFYFLQKVLCHTTTVKLL